MFGPIVLDDSDSDTDSTVVDLAGGVNGEVPVPPPSPDPLPRVFVPVVGPHNNPAPAAAALLPARSATFLSLLQAMGRAKTPAQRLVVGEAQMIVVCGLGGPVAGRYVTLQPMIDRLFSLGFKQVDSRSVKITKSSTNVLLGTLRQRRASGPR
jgi:hypothetical protein